MIAHLGLQPEVCPPSSKLTLPWLVVICSYAPFQPFVKGSVLSSLGSSHGWGLWLLHPQNPARGPAHKRCWIVAKLMTKFEALLFASPRQIEAEYIIHSQKKQLQTKKMSFLLCKWKNWNTRKYFSETWIWQYSSEFCSQDGRTIPHQMS